jgi:hypothetical protein
MRTVDVNIHTVYVEHTEGDICHDDVNMVMWQHQRLPRVTHFQHFQVGMWTNKEVPRGSLYNHVVVHTGCGRNVASVPYMEE